MADLTWEEFALALAPSLGVPGKPSHELTVVAERVYDALVGAGVDVRAVVEGRPVLSHDEAALVVGAMPLQGFPVERKPDLSRLRELADSWRRQAVPLVANQTESGFAIQETLRLTAKQLTEALDAIEKGGA